MHPMFHGKKCLKRKSPSPHAIAEGVDVVCASGDKLLGGVQAGLIVGSKNGLEAYGRHPLVPRIEIGQDDLGWFGGNTANAHGRTQP